MLAGDAEARSAAKGLQGFAGSTPVLAAAVRRLCQRQAEAGAAEGQAEQAQRQSAASKQLAATLQMAMQAALCTLAGCAPDQALPYQPAQHSNGGSPPPEAPSLPYPGSGAARHIARCVLAAPDLAQGLPHAQRAQLTDLSVLPACLGALRGELGGTRRPDQAGGPPMPWADCLWALGNVTGLVAGSLVTRELQVQFKIAQAPSQFVRSF